jgi:hypothetical protein
MTFFWNLVGLLLQGSVITGFGITVYSRLTGSQIASDRFLNDFGLAIALLCLLSLYQEATHLFVSRYGESRRYVSLFGKWYSSHGTPFVFWLLPLPFLIGNLFWIPGIRTSPSFFAILCLLLLLPFLHDRFFPEDLEEWETQFGKTDES